MANGVLVPYVRPFADSNLFVAVTWCAAKSNQIIGAFAYFGPGGGSEFEAYPLYSSRLGSSSLCARIFLGYLVGTF
jgi:hypothetical protein